MQPVFCLNIIDSHYFPGRFWSVPVCLLVVMYCYDISLLFPLFGCMCHWSEYNLKSQTGTCNNSWLGCIIKPWLKVYSALVLCCNLQRWPPMKTNACFLRYFLSRLFLHFLWPSLSSPSPYYADDHHSHPHKSITDIIMKFCLRKVFTLVIPP